MLDNVRNGCADNVNALVYPVTTNHLAAKNAAGGFLPQYLKCNRSGVGKVACVLVTSHGHGAVENVGCLEARLTPSRDRRGPASGCE